MYIYAIDWIKNITRTDHMGTPQRAGNTLVGHICSVRRLTLPRTGLAFTFCRAPGAFICAGWLAHGFMCIYAIDWIKNITRTDHMATHRASNIPAVALCQKVQPLTLPSCPGLVFRFCRAPGAFICAWWLSHGFMYIYAIEWIKNITRTYHMGTPQGHHHPSGPHLHRLAA